ncbi:MAG: radical SAM protein [Ruminococcaceae bacterium]|nr:radical SAM protein [Oscillospiraceae bacterium]
MKIFFKGFNFSQDGPGNRLVYHLQGCNMRCPWCSNPEGMAFSGGSEYSTEQIVMECIRSRAMFFSGGGVTFTGGEATMQYKDLVEVLKRLRAESIHTALETNGISEHLPEIQQHVDYLVMDFKHYDRDAFKKFTGVSIEPLLKNYEYLCRTQRQMHIRIPLINHINAENPRGFAEYLSGFDTANAVFEFLPYHEYGKEKWKSEYLIEDGFVSKDQLRAFHMIFAEYHLKTIHA